MQGTGSTSLHLAEALRQEYHREALGGSRETSKSSDTNADLGNQRQMDKD